MATQTIHIKPVGDRIVVKAVEQEETTRGGVILPDSAKEKPNRGKVLAVGSGRISDDGKRIPLEVTAGSTVLYGKYSGTEIKIEGEEYVILQERDVLAIFE
jgi:chaperonin GroES